MHRKLTSISIIALMLIATLSVMSYSFAQVHALGVKPNVATPTLTLSATSGQAYDGYGAVAEDFINVTGIGFNPGADVALFWVGTYPSAGGIYGPWPTGDLWGIAAATNHIPTANEPNGCFNPSLTAETSSGDVAADGNGWWTCQVIVPSLPAGVWHLDVMQGASMGATVPAPPSTWAGTAGVAFTINPSVEETGKGGSVVPGSEGYFMDRVQYGLGGFGTYVLNTGVTGEYVDINFKSATSGTFCIAGGTAINPCIETRIDDTASGAPAVESGLDRLGSIYGDTYTVTATGETSGTKATTAPSGVGGPGTPTTFKVDPKVFFWTDASKTAAALSYDFTAAAMPFYVSGEGFPKGATVTGVTLDGAVVSAGTPFSISTLASVSCLAGAHGPYAYGAEGSFGGGFCFADAPKTFGTLSSNAVEGVKDFAITLSTGTDHFTDPDSCFDVNTYGVGGCKASPLTNYNDALEGGILNSHAPVPAAEVGLLLISTKLPSFTGPALPNVYVGGAGEGSKNYIFMAVGLEGTVPESGVKAVLYDSTTSTTTSLVAAGQSVDSNGAILEITTVALPDESASDSLAFHIVSGAPVSRMVTDAPAGTPVTVTPQLHGITTKSQYDVGDSFTVDGDGFAAGDTITATFGGFSLSGCGTVGTDGDFSCSSFTVPDMAGGKIPLVVTAPTTGTITLDPQVVPDVRFIAPSEGPPGTSVTLTAHGFDAGTTTIWFGMATAGGVKVATVTVGANGFFIATFTVPPSFSCGGDGYCWIIDVSGPGFSTLYNLNFFNTYGPGDAFPTFDVQGIFTGAQSIVHIGDVVPISVVGLVPNTHYQLNWGYVLGPGAFSGVDFTSTATGTTPPGLTFTIPNLLGPYAWPPGSPAFFNRRWLTIQPYGGGPFAALFEFVIVPSYTLSVTSGPVGTTVTVTGTAFCSSFGPPPIQCPHAMQIVFGGDPSQITGIAFLKPGTPVAFIPTSSISFIGDWTQSFVVPNVPNGLYNVWIWEDANGNSIQEVGEVGTLLGDVKTFQVGPPSGVSLGSAVQSIYGSATGLGFEETGNTFDNSGAGFAIAHRSTAKDVFVFTDSTKVNPTTHELAFAPDYGNAVVFAGPAANPTTAFYETNGFTPVTATVSGGNLLFQKGGSTVYTVSLASLSSTNDYFLLEAFNDGTHTVVVLYGVGAPGTLASGVYFDANFASFNPTNYPASAYIVHWQGASSTPLPTDTYTIVYHT